MNVLTEIKNDITGAQALADWLGGEPPVDPHVAELRALRCVWGNNGNACPMNVEPNWFDTHVKDPIAQWIMRELEEKNRMSLRTQFDRDLHMCRACGCLTRLKIWTPASVLRAHLNQKQLNQTPAFCWLRKELLP